MSYVLAVIVLAGAWALYATWLATRLRRLHARSAGAAQALTIQLARRALRVSTAVTDHAELLGSGAITLQLAAKLALHASDNEREAAESDLTRALQLASRNGPMPREQRERVFAGVITQNRRVEMARALYNDAVRDTCALRRRWQLRALRLGAHLECPKYFDIDTALATDTLTPERPSVVVIPTINP